VDSDQGRGQRSGMWTAAKDVGGKKRVIDFVKRRELLFDQPTIDFITEFYKFHEDDYGRRTFDRIIDQEYVPQLKQHIRGFSDIIPAYDATIIDLEEQLGRIAWSKIDGDKVHSVGPCFRKFIYRVQNLIVYENESCTIKAYEVSPTQLHILLAIAKKSHLLTFKRFQKLLNEMRKKYRTITAHVAENPCSLVGKENDWRFEKNEKNESRLLRFWRNIGFESFQPNKYVVKIERKTT
jgi:hypothetical protein